MIAEFRTYVSSRNRRRVSIRLISHLSDRQLLDIGLVRADLDRTPRWG